MINFPKKILVAKNQNGVTSATVCPVGKTSGEKKKADSLKNSKVLLEFDNIPLPGFTLQQDGSYYKDVWPVIDPRGFIVYIERENLNKILSVTGITEGLIQQQCVWARDNSGITMSLVPVTAKEYDQFVENTELLGNKPSMKDVNIGDEVKLQNELVGIYRGSFNLHGPMQNNSHSLILQMMNKRHVIEINSQIFFHASNPNIVQIIKRAETTVDKQESVEYLNSRITQGAVFSSSNTTMQQYWGTHGMVKLATLSKDEPVLELIPADLKDFEAYSLLALQSPSTMEHDLYIAEDSAGNRYTLEYKYGGTAPGFVFVSEIDKIEKNLVKFKTVQSTRTHYYGGNSLVKKSMDKKYTDFVKCYRLIKKINEQEQF